MLKSATDVGILRLTAGCEWDSLQRLVDGVVSDMQVHAIVIAAGLKPRSSFCRGGAPLLKSYRGRLVPACASCEG